MRRIIRALLLIMLQIAALSALPAWAEEDVTVIHHEREVFAHNFAQTVINILHDPKTAYGNRKDILRRAFSASVDIDWMAKFVLGRAWRDATDEQKEHYTALYRKYLTESYISNFAENPSKSIYDIKIFGVQDGEDKSQFTVNTQIQLMNQANLKVDYLVHEQDSRYKVQDIVIENVSLLTTQRTQFTALAANGGVDSVIKHLEGQLMPDTQEMSSLP